MKLRTFGKSGESVSEIGVGTWTMGGMWGPREDREAIDSLVLALENGVNFIDTAIVYGNGHSEELISSAFREAKKRVFVATKAPPMNHRWPASHEVSVAEVFTKDWLIQCTEQSLKNLRSDFVELQQLHVWSDTWLTEPGWDEVLAAVATLKEQGKIRYFGVSINDHQPDTALKIVASGLIDSVQVIYNIFDQTPEANLLPLCQEKNVAVIVRVPFDEGSLTGTLTPETTFHKNDWRARYFTQERLPETCARVDKLKFLIRDEVKTMAQAALKFCLSNPAVTTVIPGMRKLPHIKDCVAASDGKFFTSAELAEIKKHAWPRNFYPFQ